MKRLRRSLRRPTGPAPRIRNPLSQKRLKNDLEPRVIERGTSRIMSQKELERRQRIIAEREQRLIRITQAQRNNNAKLLFPIPDIPNGEGKSCAIVGNASSILQRKDGAIIDTHDVVVRINTPKIISKEGQGGRTDYLFVTALSAARLPRLQFPPYVVFNVSAHYTDEAVNKWSSVIRRETGNGRARPTTGFVAAMYMFEKGYNISLFGFDWFATPSIPLHPSIKSNTHWEHHYPAWERHHLLSAIAEQDFGVSIETTESLV